jgi:hypothetical protein
MKTKEYLELVMKNKYNDLQIENINADCSSHGNFGISIDWSCKNTGFGTIYISKHSEGFSIDDEFMDKEFVMKVFEKLYDMCKEVE